VNAVNIRASLSRKKLIGLTAVLIAGSMTLAEIPANAAPGDVTRSSDIVLGMQLPETGPASPGYNKIDDAMRGYFDYVNSKGGIGGKKIRLEVKDDGYKAGLTISTASSLINKEKVFGFVGSVGTQTHIAVIKDINRRKIPDAFVNTGYTEFYKPATYPTTFAALGTYVTEAKIMGKYLKEKYPDKKIGILYQTDDFGRNALKGFTEAGLKFEAKKTSANFISGTQGSIGLASQISQLKANGVEIAIIAAVSSGTAVALLTASALSYKPEKWVSISVGADATTIQTIAGSRGIPAAASAALLNGMLSASHAPAPGDSSDEYVAAFKKINDDFNKGADKRWDNNVLQGMNIGYMTVGALMGTLNTKTVFSAKNNRTCQANAKKGTLSRVCFIDYLESNGSKIESAAFTPLQYSAKTHEAFSGFWIGAYDEKTVLQPVGETRVVYSTDSGRGPVTVSDYKRPAIADDALPKN
jgi:ABC-type branched-subunit amino acid transport system substrate-binding protein